MKHFLIAAVLAIGFGLATSAYAQDSCPMDIELDTLTTGDQFVVARSCDLSLDGAASAHVNGETFVGTVVGTYYVTEIHVTMLDKNTGETIVECHDANAVPLEAFSPALDPFDPIGSNSGCSATVNLDPARDIDAVCIGSGPTFGEYDCNLR